MKKIFVTMMVFTLSVYCFSAPTTWSQIEKLFQKKGATQGDMFKITFPRTDLDVTMESIKISPDLALTTWLVFKPAGKSAVMMGDLVILDSEVPRVELMLDSAGIAVTGMHNHIIGESPEIIYMHIMATGDAVKLAGTMKNIFAATGTPIGETATRTSKYFDWSPVDSIMGTKGTVKGDVVQYGIPLKEKVMDNGMEITPYMGLTTSVNFQIDGSNAAVTGDFVLLSRDVQAVMHTLLSYDIPVTAIHNHLMNESPKIYFLHFWGYDEPVHLANGIHAALDAIGKGTKKGTAEFNLKQ
ncbi:MAG: DUF1259 domain-containing protein [Bacteroidota bacterium]